MSLHDWKNTFIKIIWISWIIFYKIRASVGNEHTEKNVSVNAF